MNWAPATCWALLLAAAFLCDSGAAKGGRGGARGSRARCGPCWGCGGRAAADPVRTPPRQAGTPGTVPSARAPPGSAAGGARTGSSLGAASGRSDSGDGWIPPGPAPDEEDAVPGGNGTGPGVYSYRAWTSGAGPTRDPRLCLVLGGALLGLLRP
uniref:Shadow of prion protein n=1 Tax=Aotus nancymaae TaxID=37293 RepID=A0A2K5D2D2_AOTNA